MAIQINIDKKLIERVSGVCRLKLSEEEKEQFVKDFSEILDAFSVLDEAEVLEVKPSFQPVEIKDKFRDDLVEDSLSQKDALKNSGHNKDGYFKGPKAV